MYNSRVTVSDCALKMGKSTSGGGDSSSLLMPGVKSDDRSRERKPRKIRCPAIAKTPDELEASFIQLYAAYSEAAAHNKEEGEFADCEKKLIEMIFQGRAAVAKTASSSRELIIWVSAAIRGTKWDAKVCAVGFLHTLLMNYTENRLLLGTDTLPAVVDALSSLIMSPEEEKTEKQKRKEEEEDLPLTLFGCLFFLLEYPDNKVHFVNAGGIEAMIKLLQDGQKLGDYIYGSAIVALDIVKDCLAASDKFENDDLELGIAIFPASMDMILSTTHCKEEIEERLISLIESLTGGKTENYTLLEKFGENDWERITWLMELFTRYSKRVGAVANRLKSEQLDSFELYKKKCGDGFSTLQSIAVILGYLWLPEIKAKIESELSRHRIEKKLVLDVLSVCIQISPVHLCQVFSSCDC
ncbi:uncharacterized protein LOC113271803 isoform X3 [Papaver somniferum]|uniref:uncharacterized protein LOC113271803 isoform X3 n=1 Tax=Papaver somniferum TaxID=3469 RepID=UPI000E6F57E2|nr:uncharacterized protein LOC113271803 isoform X3 [Papaver somniferum]